MRRIAWFTPFSRKSAIGQYSSLIVSALATTADVTVYASDIKHSRDSWLPNFKQVAISETRREQILRDLTQFDAVIYNLGDYMPFHREIYEISLAHPGICVLHDLVMHHFFLEYLLEHLKDTFLYRHELEYSHGAAGKALAENVLAGRIAPEFWSSKAMLDYPMAKSALRESYGVIVHSEFSRQALSGVMGCPVVHLAFPKPKIVEHSPATTIPQKNGQVRLLTYGMINPNKAVAQVVEAIGKSNTLRSTVMYDIIGKTDPVYEGAVRSLIEKYQLNEQVRFLGYQPDDVLYDAIYDADVVINLRNPHFGESSWSLLETAFMGKAAVVWKHGFYDEFPDDAVAKVQDDTLASVLESVCANAQRRAQMSENIKKYAQQTFVTDTYCKQLLHFIESTKYNHPAFDLTDFVASQLMQMGVSASSQPLFERIGDEIALFMRHYS